MHGQVVREGSVDACKDAKEVGCEGLYCTLGCIGMMNIGGNKLVGCLPVMGDGVAVVLAGLVVEDLMLDNGALFLKTSHDADVRCNAVSVVARLEGFDDGIAFAVVS